MAKRIVEISAWARPLRYAGYCLVVPLLFAGVDLVVDWRSGADPRYGRMVWAVFLMTAISICDFCARRMETGPPVTVEAIGGLIVGSFGIAIALMGMMLADGTTEVLAILAFGGAFIGIGAFLVFYVDRRFNRPRKWKGDPNVAIVRRQFTPLVRRGLVTLCVTFGAMLLAMDMGDAIFLGIFFLVPVLILLLIADYHSIK